MKCFEIKENLESFLDNQTDAEIRQEIKLHLDSCAECSAKLESLQVVRSLLPQELPISAPKDLDVKVFAAFRQHQQTKKRERWNWLAIFVVPKPIFAILALCFLTGLAFLLGRMTAPTQPIIVSTPEKIKEAVPTEVIKYVEVPTNKVVEVPVERERIVTRTVYRNTETPRKFESAIARRIPKSENLDSAQQLDLKDFQPLGEISPKIVKKGEMNEK